MGIRVLADLDDRIGEMLSSYDSASKATDLPDISNLQKTLRMVVHDMDMAYGKFGSLFRTGSRNTMFAGQVLRFADLYGSSFINLFFYPFSFLFRAEAQLMPHETSINQDAARKKALEQESGLTQVDEEEDKEVMSSISMRADNQEEWTKARKTNRQSSIVAGMTNSNSFDNISGDLAKCNLEDAAGSLNGGSRPTTPTFITHAFDEDDSDEEDNLRKDDRKMTGAEKDSDESETKNGRRRRLDTDNN